MGHYCERAKVMSVLSNGNVDLRPSGECNIVGNIDGDYRSARQGSFYDCKTRRSRSASAGDATKIPCPSLVIRARTFGPSIVFISAVMSSACRRSSAICSSCVMAELETPFSSGSTALQPTKSSKATTTTTLRCTDSRDFVMCVLFPLEHCARYASIGIMEACSVVLSRAAISSPHVIRRFVTRDASTAARAVTQFRCRAGG